MSDQTREVLEAIVAGVISVGFIWLMVTAAEAAEIEYTPEPVRIELLVNGKSVLGDCTLQKPVDRKDTEAEKIYRFGQQWEKGDVRYGTVK